MKSGTARKVQDLRPSVADQQQVNKGEKRPHRQKPSIVPAVHSAEPVLTSSVPGQELLTSRFAPGSRGFVLAALKQRSQHALEKVGPPSEEREPSCYLGNGINAIDPVKTVMDPPASQQRDDTPHLPQRGGCSQNHQMLETVQNLKLQSPVGRQLTTAGNTAHTAPESTSQQFSPSDIGSIAMATRSVPYRSHQNLLEKPPQNQYLHPPQSGQSQSKQVQRRPLDSSTLEEARRVLHQVERQKKVLEENLQAILRVRSEELLYSQLEALVNNRNQNQQVRIQKMVDTWINTLMQDIQADISPHADKKKCSDRKDAVMTSHQGSVHPLGGMRRGPCVAGTRERSSRLWVAEPDATTGRRPRRKTAEEDTSPSRLYGGARRTLKKSPYLRFSSPPSQPSRKPPPRVVERVTGVKVKSCKTQTCLAPPLGLPPQCNDITHPALLTAADPTLTHAVPMAIPLGRPRTDAISDRPRTDAISDSPTQQLQEMTSSPAVPPAAPVVAMVDVATEPEEDPRDAGEAHFPHLDMIERNEDADLLPESVCEVVQDEDSPSTEEVVQLDGEPTPPLVQYYGPLFPPQACVGLSDQDQGPIPTCSPGLANQLMEWVEQQLISRMISEMYQPPPSDPQPQPQPQPQPEPDPEPDLDLDTNSTDQSGHSITSDNILIRQLVEEVLFEHMNLMHQVSLVKVPEPGLVVPTPEPGSHLEEEPVSTPQPTPPSSPIIQSRTSQPLATPPPSEPTSLLMEEPPQSISAPDPVITPTSSPQLSPLAADLPAVAPTPPPVVDEEAEVRLVEQRAEERLSAAEEEASLPPDIRVASHCSLTEDSSNTSNSHSSTTVESEAACKAVSEGELLSNVQLEDTLTEEVLCSFSTSLQDTVSIICLSVFQTVQEFDPPSEGQAGGQDLLLTNMEDTITLIDGSNQGWTMSDQQEDVSVGEVRDVHTTGSHL